MADLSLNLLRNVSGVGAATIRAFQKAGYRSLADVQKATRTDLLAISGVGETTADDILKFLSSPAIDDPVKAYRHDATRKNIPPAGLAGQGKVEERPAERYSYDPHLPPVLRFDDTGEADQLPDLLQEAQRRKLTTQEAQLLAEALRNQQPWLEWTGKREKRWFEVDPVALHIHERVAAEAIIATARRKPLQASLFADPELEYREALRFYQHDMDWTNRLILGDSLTVMHSLARREDLAGKVQMIYMDPPYGIKFSSNFQPLVNNREVKDRANDLTREPEQVKAYRDTWTLGVHSYLAYLRDRLIMVKELLAQTGSIFVQISDDNVHHVRELLDEVFDSQNFVTQIIFQKTTSATSNLLASVSDYILWYARDIEQLKYNQLYLQKRMGEDGSSAYSYARLPNGDYRSLSIEEKAGIVPISKDEEPFTTSDLTSQNPGSRYDVDFNSKVYRPEPGWWKTDPTGMKRLKLANRLYSTTKRIRYLRYLTDFSGYPINNTWTDTGGDTDKIYIVQTTRKVIERCMLMATDPGDLVLDPTCGSGTTAYVAEQWGRRWITIDTSRVAVSLARQRLLTATYDYYEVNESNTGINSGLTYQTIPHITLGGIAQNSALDPVFEKWEPILAEKLATLNAALVHATAETRTKLQRKLIDKERTEGKRALTDADERRWNLPKAGETWREWQVPFDTDPDWPQPLQEALLDYRRAWRQKMDEVNETISASAPQEVLVDQPKIVKNVTRVSGPFTVEGVQPIEQSFDAEPDSPISGAPDELDSFGDTFGIEQDPTNAEAYLDKMVKLLRQDGVRFPDNKVVKFERLDPLSGENLHAQGEWVLGEQTRQAAVAFGPQYGPITAKQVEDALWSASRGGYDDLVLAGFTIDGAAQAIIQDDPNPRVRTHLAHIRPDANPGMGDLLKDTPSSQLFTVFGEPRVSLRQLDNGEYEVTMEGVDIYDPVQNTIHATQASKVAAWFLDPDYDGQTFCIGQAFFPDKSAWSKLAKALKTLVDPQRFAAFSGTTSLPFPVGAQKRAAVKVIDPRGNEVMRVIRLGKEGELRYE